MKQKIEYMAEDIEYTTEDLLALAEFLRSEENVELGVEILWSAFHLMKKQPKSSIKECIEFGIKEWNK